jgi:histidine triad (HIT) family protein
LPMSEHRSILKGPLFNRLVIWMLENTPFLLPVKRLHETENLLAFNHPSPSYPFHILLMPKKKLRSLEDLDPGDPFLADLLLVTRRLVAENHLSAYRLIVNGGEYQEFPHLHFHLVAEKIPHA